MVPVQQRTLPMRKAATGCPREKGRPLLAPPRALLQLLWLVSSHLDTVAAVMATVLMVLWLPTIPLWAPCFLCLGGKGVFDMGFPFSIVGGCTAIVFFCSGNTSTNLYLRWEDKFSGTEPLTIGLENNLT